MAKFKFLVVIFAVLSYIQIIHGQASNASNNPTGTQNLNQGFSNKATSKSTNENTEQNENYGKSSNFNTPGQFNIQKPQALPTLPQSFSQQMLNQQQNLQQNLPQTFAQNTPQSIPQNFPQNFAQNVPQNFAQNFPLNFAQNFPQNFAQNFQQNFPNKPKQLSELQMPILYQPLNIQQQPSLQQPLLQDISSQLFPYQQATIQSFNPNANINYPQVPGGALTQKNPIQVAQVLPSANAFVSPYSPVASVLPYGCQRKDFIPNLEGNYGRQYITVPYALPETQTVKSYPIPYQAAFSSPNPSMLGNSVPPYMNQAYNVVNRSLDPQNNMPTDEDLFETNNLTALLSSLLQSKKSSNQPQYYSNYPYMPYGSYNTNTSPKSSLSLKTLLPLILDVIKEKREGCGGNDYCSCCRKNKPNTYLEPQFNNNCSKKRNYNLRDEMFRDNNSEEDTPRIAREHKKCKKLKNSIPIESIESKENDVNDSDEFSDEQD